jgi:hypothetical protein
LLAGIALQTTAQDTGPPAAASDAPAKAGTLTFEPPTLQSTQCAAMIELSYFQRNTIARVTGKIENKVCAASGGEYTLAVNVRDANGEIKTLEFVETWQRLDDKTVEFAKDYPIGENVDLTSVRSRRLRCTCAEAPKE